MLRYTKEIEGVINEQIVSREQSTHIRDLEANGWTRDESYLHEADAGAQEPGLMLKSTDEGALKIYPDPQRVRDGRLLIEPDERHSGRDVWERARGEHLAGRMARGDVRDPLPDGSDYYSALQQRAAYAQEPAGPQGPAVKAMFTINNVYVSADFASMELALEWFQESLKGIEPPTTITFTSQHAQAMG